MAAPFWSCAHWYHVLFPDPPRPLPYARVMSIALRTVHIAAVGILLGGHAFEVPAVRLLLWLYLSIISGAGLFGLALYSRDQRGHSCRKLRFCLSMCLHQKTKSALGWSVEPNSG
jgi:hypothetical protein